MSPALPIPVTTVWPAQSRTSSSARRKGVSSRPINPRMAWASPPHTPPPSTTPAPPSPQAQHPARVGERGLAFGGGLQRGGRGRILRGEGAKARLPGGASGDSGHGRALCTSGQSGPASLTHQEAWTTGLLVRRADGSAGPGRSVSPLWASPPDDLNLERGRHEILHLYR